MKIRPSLPRPTGPGVVEIGLCALLATAMVGGAWRLSQAPAAIAEPAPPTRKSDPAAFARVDAFHRGGPSEAANAAMALAGWRLMATRTGDDASAILQRPDGTQVVLASQERTEGAPRLVAVATDHVLLADGGRTVRLEFTADPPPPPAPPGGATAALGADAAQAAASMGLPTPEQDAYVAALRPHVVDGKIDGYVWRRAGDGDGLAAAGLREGDVLLSVGGEPITSTERVGELGQMLRRGGPVEIRFRRGGQEITTTYVPPPER